MSYSLHKKKAGPSKQTDHPQRDDHAGDGPKPEAPSTSALPLYAGEQPVLRLSAENQATTKPPPGLPVNPPDNDLEQDADRVADQVMRTPGPSLQRACACGGGGCSECQGEQQAGQAQGSVQARSIQSGDAGQGQAAPPIVGEVLSAPGRALDSETRAFMEPRLGRDFGDVRTHTDKKAAESTRAVEARAYTVGSDIAFGGDGFDPHTSAGRHLLAHELAHVVQQGKAGGPGHDASDGAQVMRAPVAKKPVVRKNATELFGSAGPPATTGITVEEFESYTRVQADWFAEPTLSAADRDFLWELLLRVTANPHLLAGVGDLKLTTARGVPAADWPPLDAFSRAADSTKQTVRVLSATAYTLPQRVTFGQTLIEVEKLIPPDVLELTVSELQLMEINTLSLLPMLNFYWTTFKPHVQMTYVPALGARAPEFQRVLDLLSGWGILPFLSLMGNIRNLHRFSSTMLNRLVTNWTTTDRKKPVHLVIHTGHDAKAFQQSMPLFEDLVLSSPNLILMLEGQGSLADITTKIPVIAKTYGQPDATGTPRLGQAMIAGHGEFQSVELAGTGVPKATGGSVHYPSESLNINPADPVAVAKTDALLNALLSNLDPATAKVVYAGCLVGSNTVPEGTPAAGIAAHIAANPNLVAHTEALGATHGLKPGFVQGARASVGLSAAKSLRTKDAAGNLEIDYPFDPAAFGKAAAYVASGVEPAGMFRAAVEVAATSGPLVAEFLLRFRLSRGVLASDPWWGECTLAMINVALSGIAPGAGVPAERLNTIVHFADIPFLARFGGDTGITAAHFVGRVNARPAFAGDVYKFIEATPTFTAAADDKSQIMRLVVEQGWLNFGGARSGPLITYLDATPALTTNIIRKFLQPAFIAASSPALFPAAAAVTDGRVRLALAWLLKDPANADVRAFLNTQVLMPATGPEMSAAVRAQLGGINENKILELLGRLTATTTTPGPGGTTVTLPNANVELTGDVLNDVRVEPQPYVATVTADKLNIRRRPSMGGRVLDVVLLGATLRVMGFTGDWAAVDHNGRLGFVRRTFITAP